MPIKPLRSLKHLVHACSVLGIVLLVAPVGILWLQPWILWLSLWFLSQRTNFWAQLMASLLLGLQLDVLAGWPLGMGVALVAAVEGSIVFLSQVRTGWKRGVLFVCGTVFSLLWLQYFQAFSWWLFLMQLVGVAFTTSLEGKRE